MNSYGSILRKSKSFKFEEIGRHFFLENSSDMHPLMSRKIRQKYSILLKTLHKSSKSGQNISRIFDFRGLGSMIIPKLLSNTFQIIITLIAILIYLISTYLPHNDTTSQNAMAIKYLELLVTIIISALLVLNFIISKKKLRYFFQINNVLDIITILPTYLQFITTSTNIGFLRIFRIMRIIRMMRLMRYMKRRIQNQQNEFGNQVTYSLIILFAFIFFSSGFFQYFNSEFNNYFAIKDLSNSNNFITCSNSDNYTNLTFNVNRNYFQEYLGCSDNNYLVENKNILSFDTILYFVIITVTTIGYGDIVPVSIYSKILVGVLLTVMWFIVSKQSGEIDDAAARDRSKYSVVFKSNGLKHVILGGFFSRSSILQFISEFYHKDHNSEVLRKNKGEAIKLIIIYPRDLDFDVLQAITRPYFEDKIIFIKGDILDKQILEKADIYCAKHVFLLSCQETKSIKNDHFLTLASKSISQIVDCKISIQYNYTNSLLNDWIDCHSSFSTTQVKNHIMVKNSHIHGFSTLIMNLICSSSSFYIPEITEAPWMLEYMNGASQEFYIVKCEDEERAPKGDFSEFVKNSYLKFGVIVIGIKRKVYYTSKNGVRDKDIFYFDYLINPYNYSFNEDDQIICIADDSESANEIFCRKYDSMACLSQGEKNILKKNFMNMTKKYSCNDVIPEIFKKKKISQFTKSMIIQFSLKIISLYFAMKSNSKSLFRSSTQVTVI